MTSRPRASARSMTSGRTPWARMTTAAPWSTSSSVSTVWMPRSLQVADDALVVDDLAEGVRRLAGRGRLLGLVDRLAHAVAEAGALRDADLLDGSHASSIARGPVRPVGSGLARSGAPARRRAGEAAGRAMRRMIRSVAAAWPPCGRVRRAARRPGGTANRPGSITWPPGCGSFWPRGQTLVRAGDPDRHDRRTGAQGQDRRAILACWSAPSGCASPPGRRTGRGPRRGRAWRAGTPRRRRRRGRPAWTPPLRGDPADDRPVEQLPLAEPVDPPAERWHERTTPSTTASRFEAWFAARITGPSRGTSSIAPSTRTRVKPARSDA